MVSDADLDEYARRKEEEEKKAAKGSGLGGYGGGGATAAVPPPGGAKAGGAAAHTKGGASVHHGVHHAAQDEAAATAALARAAVPLSEFERGLQSYQRKRLEYMHTKISEEVGGGGEGNHRYFHTLFHTSIYLFLPPLQISKTVKAFDNVLSALRTLFTLMFTQSPHFCLYPDLRDGGGL